MRHRRCLSRNRLVGPLRAWEEYPSMVSVYTDVLLSWICLSRWRARLSAAYSTTAGSSFHPAGLLVCCPLPRPGVVVALRSHGKSSKDGGPLHCQRLSVQRLRSVPGNLTPLGKIILLLFLSPKSFV
ncbi:hypothetical protein BJY01DRAFT_218905 [Aspergillus pseudoustus]|uniref:Uncharacterized protein n=1 Tax=Aspergillus pseudoustus TaxID=1810923 RepID=A0ABR4JIN3_9EURO